jgi:hypothetical protein
MATVVAGVLDRSGQARRGEAAQVPYTYRSARSTCTKDGSRKKESSIRLLVMLVQVGGDKFLRGTPKVPPWPESSPDIPKTVKKRPTGETFITVLQQPDEPPLKTPFLP